VRALGGVLVMPVGDQRSGVIGVNSTVSCSHEQWALIILHIVYHEPGTEVATASRDHSNARDLVLPPCRLWTASVIVAATRHLCHTLGSKPSVANADLRELDLRLHLGS